MQPDTNLNSDFHIHTTYSDGVGEMRSVIEHAIQKGMNQIAVTDHMPLPFRNRYAMRPEHLGKYRDDIKRFRDEYSDLITIGIGLEMEYLPGYESWTNHIIRQGWDHAIGSVHAIRTKGGHGLVNGTLDEFERTLYGLFGGNMYAFCTAYYRQIQIMIDSGLFHAVGHLDVIKKHNKTNCYFEEDEDWYRNLIFDTLEHLEVSGMTVEINTGGFHHPVCAPYPSYWIISECLEREIPLILSSDAHFPQHIGRDFDRVQQIINIISAPFMEDGHIVQASV